MLPPSLPIYLSIFFYIPVTYNSCHLSIFISWNKNIIGVGVDRWMFLAVCDTPAETSSVIWWIISVLETENNRDNARKKWKKKKMKRNKKTKQNKYRKDSEKWKVRTKKRGGMMNGTKSVKELISWSKKSEMKKERKIVRGQMGRRCWNENDWWISLNWWAGKKDPKYKLAT